MSQIFDALQKSEAERAGLEFRDLTATELLQVAERGVAVERESAVQPADFPVGIGTGLSWLAQPELALPSLQDGSEGKGNTAEPCALEIGEKQRDELLKFVQHVFLLTETEGPRSIMLTSTEPGSGSSWICSRAGDILASQVKAPICVVDANWRSPGLHQIFGLENRPGLSDALQGTEPISSFVRPTAIKNLWLLSSGTNAAENGTLLGSQQMRLRLAELRQYFRFVLLDSPALNLGSEGILLGRAVEGVVLVLKANSSRREVARKAVQEMQNAGLLILGAILNQRTFPIPQAIYNIV